MDERGGLFVHLAPAGRGYPYNKMLGGGFGGAPRGGVCRLWACPEPWLSDSVCVQFSMVG